MAGYGIADALTSVTFGIIQNRPTTIAGYGITDAFDGVFSSLQADQQLSRAGLLMLLMEHLAL